MDTVDSIVALLREHAREDQLAGMSRYGIVIEGRLGVSIPDLRKMAKQINKNHAIALKLWDTGLQDARILAGMIDNPSEVTEAQMDIWVKDINSWDVCDQLCSNLFEKTRYAKLKINEWAKRDEEFVRRAAFTLIACLALHDKLAGDKEFISMLAIIKSGALDERNFVRKAVNWALRNIGKRNRYLNKAALETARDIMTLNSKSVKWIAADAIRELESRALQLRLNKNLDGI
jgi:3-methyladenine DNA glycosylase AlkD